jgi:hypothetical protein
VWPLVNPSSENLFLKVYSTMAVLLTFDGDTPTCWWVKKAACARCAKRCAMQLLQSILHDRIGFHILEVS